MKLIVSAFFLLLFQYAPAQKPAYSSVDFIQQIKLNQSDTVYIINFWATWCKPCIEELPAFLKIDSLYRDKKVRVILFSIDTRSQVETKLIPFLQKHNIPPDMVLITDVVAFNKRIDEINNAWSGALPATIISGKAKHAKLFFEKQLTFEELEQLIRPLIINP